MQRAVRYALVGLCVLCFGPGLAAQQRISPAEVGQIVDAVLQGVVPPDHMLSCVTVAQRGIFFDYGRTLQAFGFGAQVQSGELHLRRRVAPGTQSLLDDCGPAPAGGRRCGQLGSGVYVWVEPVSMTDSAATVRAHLLWPDRGTCGFPGGASRASLVGYAGDVQLARSRKGAWRFIRQGQAQVY